MPKFHAAAVAVIALCATTGLAACGGDSRPYDEVPASTPALLPPEDADSAAGDVATPTTPTTTTAPDAGGDTGADTGGTDGTDTGGTGGGTGGTGGGTGGGGGEAPNSGGITPN